MGFFRSEKVTEHPWDVDIANYYRNNTGAYKGPVFQWGGNITPFLELPTESTQLNSFSNVLSKDLIDFSQYDTLEIVATKDDVGFTSTLDISDVTDNGYIFVEAGYNLNSEYVGIFGLTRQKEYYSNSNEVLIKRNNNWIPAEVSRFDLKIYGIYLY